MKVLTGWTSKHKSAATSFLIFIAAFAWFWFWRPYGLYGGDLEALEQTIYLGWWTWHREPLVVALLQLSHQLVTRWLGWPIGNSISLVSCLAGATTVLILWYATRGLRHPNLTWCLILCSGYTLNFHGAIEIYAIPTAMIAVLILSIHQVGRNAWPNQTIPLALLGLSVCHLFGVLLLPALLVSAYLHRARMTVRDRITWMECVILIPLVFLVISLWTHNEGNRFDNPIREFFCPIEGLPSYLPIWSLKHLTIKGYFLGLGTGIALPFAIWRVWRDYRDTEIIQVAAIAGISLIFLSLFHPDIGYRDWDLFLFPSLPIAYLGAPVVAESSRRIMLSLIWIAVFFSMWLPRIPVWAQLSERGLAEVRIVNPPDSARLRLDDRYPVERTPFWVGGGIHSISVRRSGERIRWKVFQAHPGTVIHLRLPEGRVPGPFSDQIQRLKQESEEETGFNASP